MTTRLRNFLLLLSLGLSQVGFATPEICSENVYLVSPDFLHNVVDLPEALASAQEAFEAIYFDKLIGNKEFFDDCYNNNLVISTAINSDFSSNGAVLMKLIDFLEQKNDLEILCKLNNYFYILFHQHLAHLEIPREKQVAMTSALYYLYHNPASNEVLRSVLTRIFIHTVMVEIKRFRHSRKKELLLLTYEYFRSVLNNLAANPTANIEVFNKVNAFVDDFAAYSIQAPIVSSGNIKYWLTVTATVSAVALIGVGSVWYVGEHFGTWDNFWNHIGRRISGMAAAGVNGMVKAIAYEYDPETGEPILIDPVTRQPIPAGGVGGIEKPNPHTEKLFKSLSRGLIEGVVYDLDPVTGQPILDAAGQPMPNRALQRGVHNPLESINATLRGMRAEQAVINIPIPFYGNLPVMAMGLEARPLVAPPIVPPAPRQGMLGLGWRIGL